MTFDTPDESSRMLRSLVIHVLASEDVAGGALDLVCRRELATLVLAASRFDFLYWLEQAKSPVALVGHLRCEIGRNREVALGELVQTGFCDNGMELIKALADRKTSCAFLEHLACCKVCQAAVQTSLFVAFVRLILTSVTCDGRATALLGGCNRWRSFSPKSWEVHDFVVRLREILQTHHVELVFP